MPSVSKIFIIGGTGAQGIPVVRGLVSDGKYAVRILTRNVNHRRAQELYQINPEKVELMEGTFTDESVLRKGMTGCDGAFVNIDGFNVGEKGEIFWAIRTYEIAMEIGLKFYVYGNIDYITKKGGYNPNIRAGHMDGKGRIGEWILFQTKDNGKRMGAAIFTTGPYMEMSIAKNTPMSPTVEDGVVTWRLPLADGAVVNTSLDDCEYYVRWLFDHPEEANGMDLGNAIAHMPYAEVAAAFEKVTGHPARYIDTSMEEYWKSGPMAPLANSPAGYSDDVNNPAAMTVQRNFSGMWNVWRHSAGNNENSVVRKDYALLDKIHPNRIKSAEEWFRREDKKGREQGLGSLWDRVQPENLKPVLKISEDQTRQRAAKNTA